MHFEDDKIKPALLLNIVLLAGLDLVFIAGFMMKQL